MRRPVHVVAVLVMMVAVGACGSAKTEAVSSPTTSQPATGLVEGTLAVYGGARESGGCHCSPQAGMIRLVGPHGDIDVSVGKSGRFSARIPAGRYGVEAGLSSLSDWPMGTCLQVVGSDARHDPHGQLSYIVIGQGERVHVGVGCLAP